MREARAARDAPRAPSRGLAAPAFRAAPAAARAATRAATLAATLALVGCGGEPRATPDTTATPGPATIAPADSVVPAAVDSAPTVPAAVSEFLRHVEARRTPDSASVTAVAAAEGLRLLAAALEAIAARDTASAAAVRPRLDALRARADSAQRDSVPADRARRAGEAFVLAGDLLQTLQDRTPPALTDRAAEARQAAAAIRSDQPLSAQTDAIRRFFERAAAALRGMAGATTAP